MTISRRRFLGVAGAASIAGVCSLEAQATPADLVLFNGKIVTVDDAFSIREAIVIRRPGCRRGWKRTAKPL